MKILCASMPFEGHFNPLLGIAAHLKSKGHDVRFYTGPTFASKLARLDIPHLPFQRATDVNAENIEQHFPEYEKLGTGPKAIEFALTKVFFGNLEAHYRDVCDVHKDFAFDAAICDGAFYAAHLIGGKLQPRTYLIGPGPTPAPTSKTAPPPFLGLKPAKTILGRVRDRVVSAMVESSTKPGMKIFNDLLARESLPPFEKSVFDLPISTAKVFFQSGVPGMDYPRDDFPPNYRFVGPLLPPKRPSADLAFAEGALAFKEKLAKYDSMIVVSQGTVDNRDASKLIEPALEALKGTKHLVVATTGGRNTEELRKRFPDENVIVEDYIDFDMLLEDAALFICNGGYGSIMLALTKGVPILSAGKLEGKNDINARLDYRGLGLDLKTERPTPKQITAGVARVFGDPRYRANVARVKDELLSYRPLEIIEETVTGG